MLPCLVCASRHLRGSYTGGNGTEDSDFTHDVHPSPPLRHRYGKAALGKAALLNSARYCLLFSNVSRVPTATILFFVHNGDLMGAYHGVQAVGDH